jgi:hypothetical protein
VSVEQYRFVLETRCMERRTKKNKLVLEKNSKNVSDIFEGVSPFEDGYVIST